ncbi:hypothetical protein T459_24219 [Capsicum annuum]|uniref:Uncharacterized protein n=1 Tax=Capsicum annuum TaxID=4072 RepID=A0A2G2YUQ6_CAPAN|nr:hypothetical protein T459_24219 [Capsicum annuum]
MAHASVASLMRTIESLLTSNSPMPSLSCDQREEFCTLHEKVSSLEVFVKNFDKNNVSGEMSDFEVEHNRKEVLLSLLRLTINMDDTVKTRGEAELADMLQKSLKRKRYLIVLDDIWSCEVWDGMRQCFPTEDNAGSRILLTTRNNEVACYAGTENLSLRMSFMDQDESWSLFKSEAFSSEALPYEFETVGKEMEDWKSVAKDVTSFVTKNTDERCSRVLGLSYDHLTSDLKTCLLHFGIFPEDSEIPAKELMRTWMAEGFMKLENDLEGEAEKCLQELVDRCLVLVCKKSLDGTKN